ncbi:MAG: hypothetical protein K0S11_1569 [Gammaproteobacteria bacterium]|jgi:SOS response regulatory protein OraA/RecX|nr:hypothetical protein [Gammaproteobacteria bacterium]
MAIAEFFHSFLTNRSNYSESFTSKLWSSNKYLNCEEAKKLATYYCHKGDLWITQKLRNNNCSDEYIGRAIGSIANEKERAELLAVDKWYQLNHKDVRIKVVKLARYLMSQHFTAEVAWAVARDFGNIH